MAPEPRIQIGDQVLTEAQAMAVRVAVGAFRMQMTGGATRKKLGAIADGYRARLTEVETIIIRSVGQ